MDELAPTTESGAGGDVEEGYPMPEEDEVTPPPGPGDPDYPPPPSATPTEYAYPDAEETPEADE
jgi:hypothetical protein